MREVRLCVCTVYVEQIIQARQPAMHPQRQQQQGQRQQVQPQPLPVPVPFSGWHAAPPEQRKAHKQAQKEAKKMRGEPAGVRRRTQANAQRAQKRRGKRARQDGGYPKQGEGGGKVRKVGPSWFDSIGKGAPPRKNQVPRHPQQAAQQESKTATEEEG